MEEPHFGMCAHNYFHTYVSGHIMGDERHAQGKFWPKSQDSVSLPNECKQEQHVYFGIIP